MFSSVRKFFKRLFCKCPNIKIVDLVNVECPDCGFKGNALDGVYDVGDELKDLTETERKDLIEFANKKIKYDGVKETK